MLKPFPEDHRTEITELLFRRRKIEAIKRYRVLTGLGLKEAKDAIDDLEADLLAKSPEQFSPAPKGGGCLGVVAVLCACGGLGAWWWWRR